MKNLIFGGKENLSLEEKYVEALALIAGVLAVLFLPTSYIIPILLITVCGLTLSVQGTPGSVQPGV